MDELDGCLVRGQEVTGAAVRPKRPFDGFECLHHGLDQTGQLGGGNIKELQSRFCLSKDAKAHPVVGCLYGARASSIRVYRRTD